MRFEKMNCNGVLVLTPLITVSTEGAFCCAFCWFKFGFMIFF